LRAIRYCARMEFKLDPRTEEWFALALERGLAETIPPEDAGRELRQLAREDKPAAVLKAWEARGLIGTIHAQLARRHPDYEMLARTMRARDEVVAAGPRPRLFAPVLAATLGKLKVRERAAALHRLGFRSNEVDAVLHLEGEVQKTAKILAGRKTADPSAAYAFLEHTPPQLVVSVLSEYSNSKAVNKVRNYLHKWKPLRQGLPAAAAELETLGLARGPKFDKVIQELFRMQLLGKGRSPEDRTKLLKKLAGIKEPPKKKLEEKKKKPDENLKKRLMDKEAKAAEPAAAKAKTPNRANQQNAGQPPAPAGGVQQGRAHATPGKASPAKAQAATKKPAAVRKAPATRSSSKRR
jgi:tRNA nucleotidyltransferase/poly(A) polymerase